MRREDEQAEDIYLIMFTDYRKSPYFRVLDKFRQKIRRISGSVIILADPSQYINLRNNKTQYNEFMDAVLKSWYLEYDHSFGVVQCGR
jgi:hypothetical protein